MSDDKQKSIRLSKSESNKCPYCKQVLIKIPSRKKKCESCGKFMYVRTHSETRKRMLVTEKEAKDIDIQRQKIISLSRWIERLEIYNISKEYIEKKKALLSKQFKKEASYNDCIWAIFNELLLKNINSSQDRKILYYEMAIFLDEEGKDPYNMLFESKRTELQNYKQSGLKHVKILTARGSACSECRKFEGKIYSINDALKEMPLPIKGCRFHMNNDKYGFCRCCWLPIVDTD